MNAIQFPPGASIERLRRGQPRAVFCSGNPEVDRWLQQNALQQQEKHLSVTRVLLIAQRIAGYYTLASGQVDFSDLPVELAKHLPRRALPVAVLAWLGVDQQFQHQRIGQRLLAQALRDCHETGQTFAFIAVILDCIDEPACAFYQQWQFRKLPGHGNRLFLSWKQLDAMMTSPLDPETPAAGKG